MLRLRVGPILAIHGLLVLVLSVAIASRTSLRSGFVVAATACFAALSGLVLSNLRHHPFARFGPANRVTTLRAAMTALVAGLLFDGAIRAGEEADEIAWATALAVVVALALDGIDGALARRSGLASRFGAAFDMEVDALLILVLCALAYQLDKAGGFVLLIGALRYAFWAGGKIWPPLAAELPPSLFRKGVCALQVAVLCYLVTPLAEPPVSEGWAMVALAILVCSFGRDVIALLRRGSPGAA